MDATRAIEIIDLVKNYKQTKALNGINLAVSQGDFFGFLGPNGAGKTTTISIITGIMKPSSGKVLIFGEDVTKNSIAAKASIGVVPDTFGLYDEMSALDNLVFFARLHGLSKAESIARASSYLKEFDLHEKRDVRAQALSRGMKKRLMIISALIHYPKILILDEPTTGLDVQSAKKVRSMLKAAHADGMTVFLTTHYIEEADQLCNKVAFIKDGMIRAVNNPESLKDAIGKERVIEIIVEQNIQGLYQRLEQVPGVLTVHETGSKYEIHVKNISSGLSSLLEFVHRNGVQLSSIVTIRPSLEEAFLHFTGLHPDEMGTTA